MNNNLINEYGEFSYNSNTKLETDIKSIFKEYKGEKTNEFDTLERIFYNMQDTGEFAFNKMKNIKQQLNILLKGGTPDISKITTHFPPL